MAVEVLEQYQSQSQKLGVDGAQADMIFKLKGSEDAEEVRLVLEPEIPAFVLLTSVLLGTVRAVFQDYDMQHVGNGVWEAKAHYAQRAATFTFDTTGGTQHVSQSLQTMASYGTNPPNHKGAIGVANGRVAGTDRTIPQFAFTETLIFPRARVTPAYVRGLFELTGAQNAEDWVSSEGYEFAAGEALFLGASGTKRGSDDVEIGFKFAGSQNAENLTVGDIVGITKAGWDYLWVLYREVESANVLVPQPAAVYVELVCPLGDFSALLPP